MSFHRRAWYAAADEYGRRRAERYGRVANTGRALGVAVAVVLLLGIVFAVQGGFGG